MTPKEAALIKEHVENLQNAVLQLESLRKDIREAVKDSLQGSHQQYQETRSKLSSLRREFDLYREWLMEVSLIRREVLLHRHQEQLETLGSEYPEIPSLSAEEG